MTGGDRTTTVQAHFQAQKLHCKTKEYSIRYIKGLPMYGDLLLDRLGVKFLDLELLNMLTIFHWNALGSTLV